MILPLKGKIGVPPARYNVNSFNYLGEVGFKRGKPLCIRIFIELMCAIFIRFNGLIEI